MYDYSASANSKLVILSFSLRGDNHTPLKCLPPTAHEPDTAIHLV